MGKLTDDIETGVSITFWDKEECIFSFWTNIYPSYKKGDEISISVTPTPIGESKFKGLKFIQEFRVISKVVHSVEQTIADDFSTFLRLEVHLKPKK